MNEKYAIEATIQEPKKRGLFKKIGIVWGMNPWKRFIYKRRIKAVCKKWNKSASYITARIQASEDPNAGFKWNQLVTQEIFMWCRLEKQVTLEEFEYISRMRGFDQHMRVFLTDLVKLAGLGKQLTYV